MLTYYLYAALFEAGAPWPWKNILVYGRTLSSHNPKYLREFIIQLCRDGVTSIRRQPRSPYCNAIAARFFRSIEEARIDCTFLFAQWRHRSIGKPGRWMQRHLRPFFGSGSLLPSTSSIHGVACIPVPAALGLLSIGTGSINSKLYLMRERC